MKKLLFLGACLVALASSPAMAQTGEADVVIVKISEGYSSLHIAIAHGTGKPEVFDYKAKDLREDGAAAATQKILAKLYQQGYTLKGTYGGNQGYMSTLIFVRG
jgi:hypothetical protein